MNRSIITDRIRQNLQTADIGANEAEIRVQRDVYEGWNVAVISPQFDKLSADERKELCLRDLNDVTIEWAEFLTPAEAEWSGPLPGDTEPDDLPLWPESLARPNVRREVADAMFPSDLDDDIETPIIATFYSLRGGVGRSTALAYTARILAAHRLKVVCVDMDLEAPALPVLLGCDAGVQDGHGVVDLLMELDQGGDPDFAAHLVPVADSENLFVLPAGNMSANYARKLQFVRPASWYREDRNPLRCLLSGIREKLPFRPDVILLDARTGISDLSGPLLFDLADIAIVVFFPHPQARRGTELLTRSLLDTVTGRSDSGQHRLLPETRFIVSPVPSSKSREVVQRYERRPLEWIDGWLQEFNQRRDENQLMPVEAQEITHFIRYREDLATSDRVEDDAEIWRAFQPVADWIERSIPTVAELSTGSSTNELKPHVLNELSFSAGTAEQQRELIEDFVQTDNVRDALSPEVPLVLGRKGTGKTALFRFLSESQGSTSIIVHAPRPLVGDRDWILSADTFKEVDKTVESTALEWRHFWMLYIAAALEHTGVEGTPRPDHLMTEDLSNQGGVLHALDSTARIPRGPLALGDWVRTMDRRIPEGTMLLLDGLDTGFGSTPREHERRRRSIEGLFDAWMDSGQGLANLKFKILLREDIWRQLDFDNKSHLYGRSVRLHWANQTEFLKVVIKQAMRSTGFSNHGRLRSIRDIKVDNWSEDSVQSAWSVLVGERMKGGQTAYTRNWVWNRLADANEDHSPRYLLQLFHEAVPLERDEQRKSPYERTFVRPRVLTRCLPRVSTEALGALREEFGELNPLLDTLRRVGRTPVSAGDIQKHSDLLVVAREVGLIAVYEETEEKILRYKVPDLYRYALAMTRKGQI